MNGLYIDIRFAILWRNSSASKSNKYCYYKVVFLHFLHKFSMHSLLHISLSVFQVYEWLCSSRKDGVHSVSIVCCRRWRFGLDIDLQRRFRITRGSPQTWQFEMGGDWLGELEQRLWKAIQTFSVDTRWEFRWLDHNQYRLKSFYTNQRFPSLKWWYFLIYTRFSLPRSSCFICNQIDDK